MFSNVVVGVEDCAGGRHALELGSALVSVDGRITLVYVEAMQTAPNSDSAPRAEAERQRFGLERLERLRDEAQIGAEVARIQAPSIRCGLHEFAASRGADLIVIGASRRTRVARIVLGDETREVIADAPCAVAVAPTGYSAESRILKVGVAYDGSTESQRALATARRFAAERHDVQVVLFEALPPPVYVGDRAGAAAEADEELAEARRLVAELGELEAHVDFADDSVEALTRFGACVDLLVLGSSPSHSPPGRLVSRSTSRRLTERPPSPLLVLSSDLKR